VLDIARIILERVPGDEIATYNAQEALNLCETSLQTPSPTTEPDLTPQATSTP
jgi:hypothetical protein